MKTIISKDERRKLEVGKILDWIISMIAYAFILIVLSIVLESFTLNNKYFGLFALIAAILIYLLNKTIKPIIFVLTLPITALTYGLFYPFLNVINLYIVDLLLGKNFELDSIINTFFIAILISILNFIINSVVIKPLLKEKNNEV